MPLMPLMLAALAAAASLPAPSDGTRLVQPLAAGWRFARADRADAARPDLDDGGWANVTLPHSFNGGDGETGGYYRGPAWYRRAFTLPPAAAGRRLFVQFDGAATAADVYLNGRRIGRHEGGHAAFRFDISDAVRPGRNLLAVRVDNGAGKTITPLGGDFTLYGGLYRMVSLVAVDAVHVDLGDHGGPGAYVRTAALTPASAQIAITVRVANDGPKSRRVPVAAAIRDASGAVVATVRTTATVPARTVRAVALDTVLARPHLWDGVADPYLYHATARVGDGDAVTVPLGVRTIALDPARGLLLNGRPYPVHGVNLMHSARPGRGTAVSDTEIAEDFDILRDMGSTGVRLVHFQHPQAAYDAADRRGLVAWTEIGVNGTVENSAAFRANAAEQLRELIAQGYNHPSVAMWGIGNEVYATDPWVTELLAGLNAVAHAADPDRPTVYAHCCQADDHPKARVTDAIGFNRYYGWYPDQAGTTIGAWADGFHRAFPARAFAVSEYGAGASILHQEDPPRTVVPASGWHPEQYQALYHETNWRMLADKPWLFATFIWVGFDLASSGRNEGDRPGINDKGLVTADRRTRKDAWYWYQANWTQAPMLHLTSRRFTPRTRPDAEVKAYSNAGPVTLLLNGRIVGTQSPVDHIVRWPVRLQPGINRVALRSGSLRDAAEWTYAPAIAAD